MFAEFKCSILRALIGMENQTFRATAAFKSRIKHALNERDIRSFRNVKSDNAPSIEIKNYTNGAKNIFNVNMRNIAYPR